MISKIETMLLHGITMYIHLTKLGKETSSPQSLGSISPAWLQKDHCCQYFCMKIHALSCEKIFQNKKYLQKYMT